MSEPCVKRIDALGVPALGALFSRYGLAIEHVARGAEIPGSHWGAPEAGLMAGRLFVREDTPVHSALHEGCHFVCMDNPRRQALHTDAGGDALEECAVCYLSIVLSPYLPGFDQRTMCMDMDAWGYSFRLGSAARWFDEDAGDARAWLQARNVLTDHETPTWRCATWARAANGAT